MSQYVYEATLLRVIDGDTAVFTLTKDFTLEVDFGFYIKDTMVLRKSTEMTVRLLGINTPEIHAKDASVRVKAMEAKAELARVLSLGLITIETVKAKKLTDKYGRFLGKISVLTGDGTRIDVNQHMIDNGFAITFMADGVPNERADSKSI
jgi:endonuclease YncB( thermonuclease family)